MAKIKPRDWARKSAEARAEMEAEAEAPKAPAPKVTAISDERLAEIRADAKSGRNWAEEAAYGATCICGAGLRTRVAAMALKGVYGRPTGFCSRHPGGTVIRDSDWRK